MVVNISKTVSTSNLCRWSRSNVVLECMQSKDYLFQQFLLLFFLTIVFFKRQRTSPDLSRNLPPLSNQLQIVSIDSPRTRTHFYVFFCKKSLRRKNVLCKYVHIHPSRISWTVLERYMTQIFLSSEVFGPLIMQVDRLHFALQSVYN